MIDWYEEVKRRSVSTQPEPETPEQSEPMSWGEAATAAVGNIPESAGNLVKNIAYPVTNFGEFTEGIGKLATGDSEAWGGMRDFLVNRYGGEEEIKRTLAEDPIGLLSDVALLFTGAGGISKGGALLSGSAKAGTVAKGLGVVGKAVDPVNLALRGGTSAVGKAVSAVKSPESMYSSVLKKGALSSKLTPEQQMQNAQTGLKYGIVPSQKGLDKIDSMLSDIDQKIGPVIDSASAAGGTVKRDRILRGLNELASPSGPFYHSDQRAANLSRLNKIKENVLANYGEDIPVADAQKLKQNVQRSLSKDYTKLSDVTKTGRKSLGHDIRMSLVEAYPELAPLNQGASELINLQKAIEAAIPRIESKDLFGLSGAAKTGTGAIAGNVLGAPEVGTLLGMITAAADIPSVKARLAIALDKARRLKMQQRGAKTYATREASRQAGQAVDQIDGEE